MRGNTKGHRPVMCKSQQGEREERVDDNRKYTTSM